MNEIVQHTINYTVDELKQIYKTGEAFRKYPKNQKFALDGMRQCLETITSDIEVSNLGHIKIDGVDVPSFKKDDGDIYVTLQNNIDYKIYRLVAETWCHFPFENTLGWQVHHIYDDFDNRAENLIWCKKEMHLGAIHR
jgi:hypothetical protein